jgi:tetratricopeptide (TPR) repeat protein
MVSDEPVDASTELTRVVVAIGARLRRFGDEQNRDLLLAGDASEEIACFWREARRSYADDEIPAGLALPVAGLQWQRFLADPGCEGALSDAVRLWSELVYVVPERVPPEATAHLVREIGYADGPLRWALTALEILQDVQQEFDAEMLDRAIRLLILAAPNTPADRQRDLCLTMNNLGYALRMRFDHDGRPADLVTAADAGRAAVALLAPADPNEGMFVANLATALVRRFETDQELTSLDEAVPLWRRSIDATENDAPGLRSRRLDLLRALSTRFGHTGAPADLPEILALLRALNNANVDSAGLAAIAQAFRRRTSLMDAPVDVDELIRVTEALIAAGGATRPSAGAPAVSIRIEQVRIEPDGGGGEQPFRARVSLPGGDRYEVSIDDPLAAPDEELLEWYFERRPHEPFTDGDLAVQAERVIRSGGERLFEQVFSGARYEAGRSEDVRVEIAGSAAFQRLHWELLAEPGSPVPLGVRWSIVRQPVAHDEEAGAPAAAAGEANVLLVTARPGGVDDVGHRSISQPLFAQLSQAGGGVVLDFARPGTWAALVDHLAARDRGHYLAVHFDMHGMLASFAELVQADNDGLIVLSPRIGPFPGERAFLLFETERDGVSEPVPAEQVAAVLTAHRVRIAVLNACESARPALSEPSLAAALVQAGVPTAVGMAYAVTVDGARVSMSAIYGGLARGEDLATAMRTARRQLWQGKRRSALFGQHIELADWLLPVLVGRDDVRLVDRGVPPVPGPPVTAPDADFVGRDLDIQSVERRLLSAPQRNILLVTGMAGIGKSALLRHLAWWWERTGLIEKSFMFGYDQQAWTVPRMVAAIAAAPRDEVVEQLRQRRVLLVIDSAEAVADLLDDDETTTLTGFLAELRDSRCLVIIGSRELPPGFAPVVAGNVHEVRRLGAPAAADLAQRILADSRILDRRSGPDWYEGTLELIASLDGNPLALRAVLPRLADTRPEELIAGLPRQETAIALSIGRLDPAVRGGLLALAPFVSMVPTSQLEAFGNYLAEGGTPALDLAGAVREATRMGLLRDADEAVTGYGVLMPLAAPVLRELARREPPLWNAAVEAHCRLYRQLASLFLSWADGADEKKRFVGQGMLATEHNNFQAALRHAMSAGHRRLHLVVALDVHFERSGRVRLRTKLFEQVLADLGADTDADTTVLLARAALAATDGGDAAAFERYRQAALAAIADTADDRLAAYVHRSLASALITWERFDDAAAMTAGSDALLADLADERGNDAEAEAHYRRLLSSFRERGDRYRTAVVLRALGTIQLRQERYEEAEQDLREALSQFVDSHDDREVAAVLHLLGRLTEQDGRDDEASGFYRWALEIYGRLGDEHQAAYTHQMLGRLLESQDRPDGAAIHYRRARDGYAAAGEAVQAVNAQLWLGRLAVRRGRFDEAQELLESVAESFAELERAARQGEDGRRLRLGQLTLGSAYFQLGLLAQRQRRMSVARTLYGKALVIAERLGDDEGLMASHAKLGEVEQELGNLDASIDHQMRVAATADPANAAISYHNLAQIQRRRGHLDDARRLLHLSAQLMRLTNNEFGQAQVAFQVGLTAQAQGELAAAAASMLVAAVYGFVHDGEWPPPVVEALRALRAEPGGERALAAAVGELPGELAGALLGEVQSSG